MGTRRRFPGRRREPHGANRWRIRSFSAGEMAQAREPLSRAGATGVGRDGLGIRRLPVGRHGDSMDGMKMGGPGGIAVFLPSWTVRMVAMMVPATLPLILLYRTIARNRLGHVRARVGLVMMLVGYVVIWAAAGLPVYAYDAFAGAAGS